MVCRVAGYLGCAPSEVYQLPTTDFDLLQRFYAFEPWGAWRDNLHAAIIAREVVMTRLRPGTRAPDLEKFMVMDPEQRRQRHLGGFVEALKAMAGGKRKHISELKPVKRGKRGSGKTSRTPGSAVRPAVHRAGKGKQ
jgi:hypothetical protein